MSTIYEIEKLCLFKDTEEFIILLRKHPELRDQLRELLSCDDKPISTPPHLYLAEQPLCSAVG